MGTLIWILSFAISIYILYYNGVAKEILEAIKEISNNEYIDKEEFIGMVFFFLFVFLLVIPFFNIIVAFALVIILRDEVKNPFYKGK